MKDKKSEKLDLFLVTLVLLATSISIITLYSQDINFEETSGKWFRQLLFSFIGIILMFIFYRINYQLLGYYAIFIYLFFIFLLVLTLIPGIGYLPEGRGARSWLRLGPIGIQPSEFSKLATVILLGQYLLLKEREMKKITVLIIPFLIILIPMILIALQPDFGTAISFVPILFTMLFLGGADILHIGSLIVLGGISLFIPMFVEYYKITLVIQLKEYLKLQGHQNLIPFVNELGKDFWKVMNSNIKNIENKKNILEIKKYINEIIDTNGYFGYQILSNEFFLTTVGVIFIIISLSMIIVRVARGAKNLRKYYISFGIFGISLISAVLIMNTIPFRENQVIRLTAFLNPDQFRQGAGYQLRASKPAVGSGQFFGKGLMNAEMTEGKYPHVPESSTDFIFASWAEQTGFLGSSILLFILFSIPFRGLQVSHESRDRFGSLLAGGIVGLLFYHIAINIGIVIGLMPVTGVPLSFLSYGGSHLVMVFISIGIILSIQSRRHVN